MLTDEELEELLVPFRERMERINAHYIERMGEHVREIGRLKDSDIQRIRQMRIMDTNLGAIQRELAAASGINEREAAQLIETAARRYYADLDLYGMGKTADTALLRQLIEAQKETTLGTLRNLSNTTIVADSYRNVVDTAVTAVSTDMSDYNSAVRRSLREAVRGGVRVRQSDRQVFASGVTRRVDTVVRQNVLDAVSAISNEMSLRGGELFGANGVEISAHALCAEDHLPYQGEQFTNDEFDRLQMDLDRPFGFWNCRHTLYPIVVGVTEPVHTPEELEAFRAYSTEEIEFEGKKLTRYEWTQEQRRIETEVRYLKDEQIAFKASGDDLGRRRAQDRINAYQEYYKRMSAAAGLRYEDKRMVAAGFRKVKSQTEILAAGYERAVAKGDLSSLTGQELYTAVAREVETRIVGTQTWDGITIRGYKTHFIDRVIGSYEQRRDGVPVETVLDALRNGTPVDTIRVKGERSHCYKTKQCAVTVNPDTGYLIQTTPKKKEE